MPAVSNNQLYVERRLTDVSIAYRNGLYVADQAMPLIGVPDISGLILEEDKSMLQADPSGDDVIGRGEYPGLIKVELQNKNYSTKERAKETFLHDDEVAADAAQGAPYRPRIRKTRLVTERLLLNREVRVAALLTTAANWATGHNATPGTKWDAASGSDPIADINAGKLKIKLDLGIPPNVAIIPWEVVLYLSNNSSVRALTTGGATVREAGVDQSPEAMLQMMRRIFGVERILMPSAGNWGGNMTAAFKGGVGPSTGGMWGDNVVLMYQPPLPGREIPAAAYSYYWENAFDGAARNDRGQVVTEARDDRARGVFIAARTYLDEQIVVTEAGYVLTNTLTAI
jgi:hypothetical protein